MIGYRFYMKASAIAILLLLNLSSTLLIKYSPAFYSKGKVLLAAVILLVLIYFFRALIWLYLGNIFQISYIYPFLGLNYVLSIFVGLLIFDEPFLWHRMAGAVIILGGVWIISTSMHQIEETDFPTVH